MTAFGHEGRINQQLSKQLAEHDLNFARLILPVAPGEMNVTCQYAPCMHTPDRSFVVLNQNLQAELCYDLERFYYGAAPELENSVIVTAISALQFSERSGLDSFIRDNCRYFMLHTRQRDCLPAFARFLVLSMAYNFGIRIRFPKNLPIQDELSQIQQSLQIISLHEIPEKPGEHYLTIHGCPTKEMLDILNRYHYQIDGDKRITACPYDDEGKSICDVYAEKSNIALLDSDLFYSGVFLRALKMEPVEKWYSNAGITTLCIHYERATFATVYALDHAMLQHPLLSEEDRRILSGFFREDDECIHRFLNQPVPAESGAEQRQVLLDRVNNYLAHSNNVNQICVTGNIITADNILLYGERPKNTIDNGMLYPSVNGNAEIDDTRVSFYHNSANVDRPSVDIRYQSGLENEICRETEAELNVELSNNLWKCCGVTISGRVNPPCDNTDEYPYRRRRMHLNVIYEQHAALTFEEIDNRRRVAVERYELKHLHGIRIRLFDNRRERLGAVLSDVLDFLTDWSATITSVLTLMLFWVTIGSMEVKTLDAVNAIVSAVFALLTIIATVVSIVKEVSSYRKRHRYCQAVVFIRSHHREKQLMSFMNRLFASKRYHPVTYTAILVSLTGMIFP